MKIQSVSRRDVMAAAVLGAAATALGGAAKATPTAVDPVKPAAATVFPPGKIPVAFLLDEASTMMDFAGPWEVFQDVAMADAAGYFLFTVAPTMGPYDTTGTLVMREAAQGMSHGMKGLKFTPDYTVHNAPQPQIIVMGAQMNFDGPEKLDWLRRAAPGAEFVLSVCTGNFIAAYAGLLDGKRATTHHRFFDSFEQKFPRVQLVRDQRFVDNGKFISGGGITAGIDAALHIVRRQFGDEVTRKTIEYMEYRGEASRASSALADKSEDAA